MRIARLAGVACTALALTLAIPSGAASASSTPDARTVQRALDELAAKYPWVVGAIGELYVDGRRVSAGSAGSRLLDGQGGKVPVGSRYRIGSQTKQLTATVLLQMVREGRLSLEDRLSDVLPEVAGLVERSDEITVRQLIRFTSGIPDFFQSGKVDVFDKSTYHRPIDLVAMTRGMPRTGEPGERWYYSNTNYILLGMIIERLSGQSLAAEFDRRIFEPLGMRSSYLATRPPESIVGPHGHGYFPDPSGRLHDMHDLNASYGFGAGGVISTARDISAWQRAFTQGRMLPPDLQRVITDPPEGTPPPPPPGDQPCGPPPMTIAGSMSGFRSSTTASADGRTQLAVSVTLSIDNASPEIDPAMREVAKAVLCPSA